MKTKEGTDQLPKEIVEDRAIKLNPNNELYWKARGFSEKPENWKEVLKTESKSKK